MVPSSFLVPRTSRGLTEYTVSIVQMCVSVGGWGVGVGLHIYSADDRVSAGTGREFQTGQLAQRGRQRQQATISDALKNPLTSSQLRAITNVSYIIYKTRNTHTNTHIIPPHYFSPCFPFFLPMSPGPHHIFYLYPSEYTSIPSMHVRSYIFTNKFLHTLKH
jgi:hypothetical protein